MTHLQINDHSAFQLGYQWIQALVEKNFQHIGELCRPDVNSQLLTPGRARLLETAPDLIRKVERWFDEYDRIVVEQSRVVMLGARLEIFYRLTVSNEAVRETVEQQLYCSLKEGRIAQLRLVCNGFHPIPTSSGVPGGQGAAVETNLKVDARLKIDTGGGQESTCAILTPAIKRELKGLNPGQVLEVSVDDPSAQEDVEAWCRLSGNTLLNAELDRDQELRFYLMKK